MTAQHHIIKETGESLGQLLQTVFREAGYKRVHLVVAPPKQKSIEGKLPAISVYLYNITLNDGLTVRELIQKAEALTGRKVTTHDSHRPGMDLKYQVDASRLRQLGWEPAYTFEAGLKEYLLGEGV